MKRKILGIGAVVAVALATAAPVSADATGDTSFSCADITTADAAFTAPSDDFGNVTGPGEVGGSLNTATASCRGVFYTMIVTYTSGGETIVLTQTVRGSGESTLVGPFRFENITSDTDTVCVAFVAHRGPNPESNVLDRTPDNGCVTEPLNVDPGGTSPY